MAGGLSPWPQLAALRRQGIMRAIESCLLFVPCTKILPDAGVAWRLHSFPDRRNRSAVLESLCKVVSR